MEAATTLKNQGNVLMSEGRVSEAEHLYRKAIQLDPNFMAAHYNLGNSLRFQNRFKEALSAYETALHLAPDDYDICMNLGATLIDLGRATNALETFSRAKKLVPSAAEPLVNMGLALERLGRFDEAIEHYRKAILLKPDFAAAHNNLGNALQGQGNLDMAAEHYRKAILLKPNFAEAHNNLGNALQEQGQLEAAIERFKHALSLNPNFADAHYNLGNAYKILLQFTEAETSYRNALKVKPRNLKTLTNLGGLYMEAGHPDKALACFQQVVKLDPNNAAASHLIASITGANTEHAPSQYVAELFDGFAKSFDANLLNDLAYQAPRKLVALITEFAQPSAKKWDVLDLGCGTGLAGAAILPYAQKLVGVDLSEGMLAKAEAKNLYQRLEKSDLLVMMKNETSLSYDVIVAADVFVYIGRLDEILEEAKRLLRPGGILAFSVEAMDALLNEEYSSTDEKNFQLNKSGRYAHSSNYLDQITHENKFKKHKFMLDSIRLEKSVPVQGWYVVLENIAP